MKDRLRAIASRLKRKPTPKQEMPPAPEKSGAVSSPVSDDQPPSLPVTPVKVVTAPGKTLSQNFEQAPEPEQGPRVPSTKRQRKFERQVEKARKAIVSGEIEPKARPVAEHVGSAYRTALSILATLTNQGVIVRSGRGWKRSDVT